MSSTYDPARLTQATDTIEAAVQKITAAVSALRQILASATPVAFDPLDPANKYEVGGLEKLTPRGIEICYRLFDQGLTRYAVGQAMNISFGAATHRFAAWQKAGGVNRSKQVL